MQIKAEAYDVGVIVGRFQVHELHDAHVDVIQHVVDNHDKVIIFLGLSPALGTRNNPLDFESRKQMILDRFPNVIVLYIKDVHNDELWSKRLDEQISDVVSPTQSVVLYGSRDSFISHYTGKFPTQELMQERWISGTEIRKRLSRAVKATPDFRIGAIWAALNRYPTTYPTVDVAVLNEDGSKVLLARKPNEEEFRFIGGFAEPESPSYEADARREVQEEAGIEITDPVYIGSAKVDDWRYRGEVDKIKTLLFVAKHQFGNPRPDDDVAEVRWFNIDATLGDKLVPQHRVLYGIFFHHWMENVMDPITY